MARDGGTGYRPELDGLRTFAIVGVLLFHAALISPIRLLGGEFGVDLFFVLSGCLITTLLLREHGRTRTIALGRFFMRRVLRLIPALVLLLVAAGVVASIVDANRNGLPYPQAAIAAFFAVGNWFQGTTMKLGILTHTWTLAIEWQFYLLWPVVLFVALRRGIGPRQLAIFAATSAVLVAIVRAVLYHRVGHDPALYWTIARADGVLLGSALALAISAPGRLARLLQRLDLVLVAVVGSAVGVAVLRADRSLMYDGGLFLLVVCFAIVVGHVTVHQEGPMAKVLSVPPLPQLGRISYGIYLFHVPMYALVGDDPSRRSVTWAFIAIAATIVVALVSYLVVETPALRLKDRLRVVRGRATSPA